MPLGRKPKPVLDRIHESVVINPETGCWEWQLTRINGYGRLWIGSRSDGTRRFVGAHRVAYEALVGPIPDGCEIDHLCRNPGCCNPDHLEAVDHRTNMLRGAMPSAMQARQTHCKRGHEFTPENTYLNHGKRACRECGKRRSSEWNRRIAAERKARA